MLCKYNDSGDEGKKCNKNFVLLTCRVPVPVPRPACVSAPRGWGERGHSAGMEGGGALEGPDSGRSFRDSAGVCGGVIEEQIIFPHTIFCPLRNWMHLEGSKIEERLQIDCKNNVRWIGKLSSLLPKNSIQSPFISVWQCCVSRSYKTTVLYCCSRAWMHKTLLKCFSLEENLKTVKCSDLFSWYADDDVLFLCKGLDIKQEFFSHTKKLFHFLQNCRQKYVFLNCARQFCRTKHQIWELLNILLLYCFSIVKIWINQSLNVVVCLSMCV